MSAFRLHTPGGTVPVRVGDVGNLFSLGVRSVLQNLSGVMQVRGDGVETHEPRSLILHVSAGSEAALWAALRGLRESLSSATYLDWRGLAWWQLHPAPLLAFRPEPIGESRTDYRVWVTLATRWPRPTSEAVTSDALYQATRYGGAFLSQGRTTISGPAGSVSLGLHSLSGALARERPSGISHPPGGPRSFVVGSPFDTPAPLLLGYRFRVSGPSGLTRAYALLDWLRDAESVTRAGTTLARLPGRGRSVARLDVSAYDARNWLARYTLHALGDSAFEGAPEFAIRSPDGSLLISPDGSFVVTG